MSQRSSNWPGAHPGTLEDLKGIPGLSPDQIQRYGTGVLQAIEHGSAAPIPSQPQNGRVSPMRCAIDTIACIRGERNGREKRGVESDVILPRTALWDLARRPPRTHGELAQVADLGPWRRQAYGDEILALLARLTAPSGN